MITLNRYPTKKEWGPGPWQDEPDRVEFRAHGLPCLMVRNPAMGHWCGYAAVDESHPLYGIDYGDTEFEAHGGITYAGGCHKPAGICHEPLPGESADVWWFGFDCAHAWDYMPASAPLLRETKAKFLSAYPELESVGRYERPDIYRDEPYVRAQCTELAAQLAAAAGHCVQSWTFCRSCKSTRHVELAEMRKGPSVYLCSRCKTAMRKERTSRHIHEMAKAIGARRVDAAIRQMAKEPWT